MALVNRRRVIHSLLAAKARIIHGWTQNRGEGWVYGRHVVCAIQAIELGSLEAMDEEMQDRRSKGGKGWTYSAADLCVVRAETTETMLEAINQLWPESPNQESWENIPHWNDQSDRKKADVLEAFDRALKIAGHSE
jgi:hypothetical protein